MKKILFLLLMCSNAYAQLQDNFSDGNFTANPAWVGDAAQFTVNASQQLQLNSSGAGASYLSLGTNLNSLSNADWKFWIHLNFAPSSGNYARVYLASDQQNLEGPLNGYYLNFGETGSNDAVELFRQDGSTSTSVCRGTNAEIAAAFTVGIHVTRDAAGVWTLAVDPAGGTNYVTEAAGSDATHSAAAYFGVQCVYTSSNATDFYFDDFIVPFQADVTAPQVQLATATSNTALDVRFNEPVEQASAETAFNYAVNGGIGSAATATRDGADFSLVHLTFSNPFSESVLYTLTVTGVKDISNNAMTTGSADFTWYNPQAAAPGDVVINEVLFSVNTGGAEFVELYNRSSKAIDLKQLRFTRVDLASGLTDPPVSLISSTLLLPPGGYMVLTDNPGAVRSQYYTENPNAFLSMNLPDLLTDEDILVLQDSVAQTIDRLHYYSSWHFPLLNDVHGVSLERLNPDRPTDDVTNWHSASQNAGFATPGYRNSQYASGASSGSGEVTVVPEIFSPDNDGLNDVVELKFHLDDPGYVANVKVFDAKGRPIRTLVENQLIGNESVFSWDGTSDEKEKARTGIYVFFIEVFHTGGDVKEFKKTCVLATRL